MNRLFLLSPAHSGGKRAQLISNPKASFALAHRLQAGEEASIGEIFTFLSGLYFRGKLAYADAFANPPPGVAGAQVITSNRGLIDARTPLTLGALQDLSKVDIDLHEPRYREPLERDAQILASLDCEFILLGSVASGKYVDILLTHLGQRLLFPIDFVGRGDMSRGGLMLRCVSEGRELRYVPVAGAIRHGKRPARLEPVPRSS